MQRPSLPLQTLRERLTLVLVTLLPFHALLVTYGTLQIQGPGNAPMGMLAVWKEVLLLLILGVTVIEMAREGFGKKGWSRLLHVDHIDVCIFLLCILALFTSLVPNYQSPVPVLYGFKYTLFPLLVFLVLRRVAWSELFATLLTALILTTSVIVVWYGFFTLWFPMEFFVKLGYSPLHSLYLPGGPLPAFQEISDLGLRRLQSTMSGANQLGIYLLIPFGILLAKFRSEPTFRSLWLVRIAFVTAALVLTFSRSAIVAWAVLMSFLFTTFMRTKHFWTLVVLGVVGIAALMWDNPTLYHLVVREDSTRGHIERPLEAVQMILQRPMGYGLGAAGPASNRTSDACIHMGVDDDVSWAADRPDLCVFQGDAQVQPSDRDCRCPVLPENWYLQIGVELGILGMAVYILLIFFVLQRLYAFSILHSSFSILLGVSIAALFLHAWEDSAVAYSVWILCAVALQKKTTPP